MKIWETTRESEKGKFCLLYFDLLRWATGAGSIRFKRLNRIRSVEHIDGTGLRRTPTYDPATFSNEVSSCYEKFSGSMECVPICYAQNALVKRFFFSFVLIIHITSCVLVCVYVVCECANDFVLFKVGVSQFSCHRENWVGVGNTVKRESRTVSLIR